MMQPLVYRILMSTAQGSERVVVDDRITINGKIGSCRVQGIVANPNLEAMLRCSNVFKSDAACCIYRRTW